MKQMSVTPAPAKARERPIEQSAALDFGVAFGGVGGGGHQAPSTSGPDDDGSHLKIKFRL